MQENRLAALAVHLKDYVDKVLAAFQAGAGISAGLPEPITHDIARRLLWGEIDATLCYDVDSLDDGWPSDLRVSHAAQGALFDALTAIDATITSVRVIGARRSEDPTVAFIQLTRGLTLRDLLKQIATLQAHGCTVRDFVAPDLSAPTE